jgi:peptidyl-prolyl cis-trans isomerase SurA
VPCADRIRNREKTMTRTLLIAAAALVLLPLPVPAQDRDLVEGVIVQVNDDIITFSQFMDRYSKLEMAMLRQVPADQIDEMKRILRKSVFNDMINELIIKQRAEQRNIRLTDELFREQVDRMKQQIGAQSDDEFQRALASQGLTMEEFRRMMERQYYLDGLFVVEVGRDLYQSESRVQNYYEENLGKYTVPAKVRLAQLTFPVTGGEAVQAREGAEAALERLRAGEDFAQVYRDLNPDAPEGGDGDIGFLEMTALRREMAEEVRKLEPGQNTGVISLTESFVILKLTEREPEKVTPLEEIKDRVTIDMQADTLLREKSKYVARIKRQAYIKILDESFVNLYDENYFEGFAEDELQ